MAGIFDFMNHRDESVVPLPGDISLSPNQMQGILLSAAFGIRTGAQLRAEIEALLGTTLPADAVQDLQDIVAYITAGVGETEKQSRADRFHGVSRHWESNFPVIIESEARFMSGVPFTP